MPYIHFTEEQKLRANSVDLAEFLRRQGEKLIPSGRDKRLASDHSITVRGNEWYDHESKEGGKAISFVQTFYGLSYANSDDPDFMESAEKCVDSFNSLSESVINEICQKLISCAQEGDGLDEEFELPALDNPLDILDYCWFMALYVDMKSIGDEIAYAVEGEGEWGENIGFVIKNDSVVYVGADYLEHMENA